jgi:hypothetical protein
VFFTVDVEVWCDGWADIDRIFPDAFRRYVHGPTPSGHFGLPFQLELLQDHGIPGTFFVEPLFATRFGSQPLQEIVGLVRAGGQEIQLHLHTEWVDEARTPLLPGTRTKRQYLHHFSLEEQRRLIAVGSALLREAGAGEPNAFRAGSFGFNLDTLRALAANGIAFDSSYNATMFGQDSGVLPGVLVVEPLACEGVYEYPMTVFRSGAGGLRHVQLTACSHGEIEALLWQALEAERNAFVILSHNFELLNPTKNRPDEIVVKRFRKLCAFLDRNRDSFRARGFQGLTPSLAPRQPGPLTTTRWKSCVRMLEQAYRRTYR